MRGTAAASAETVTSSETRAETKAETDAPTSTIVELPRKLRCQALQTAGLHDYDGPPEDYEASTFFESKFELRINRVLTRHLAGSAADAPDLYLTLVPRNADPAELRCKQVQGKNGELGYSCTNTPPSGLLLINPATLRFTRSSIGGWTFSDDDLASAGLGDDSLFVEYGTCAPP